MQAASTMMLRGLSTASPKVAQSGVATRAPPAKGSRRPDRRGRVLRTGVATGAASTRAACPAFIPVEMEEIMEPAAVDMVSRMKRVPVSLPAQDAPVQTACVGPASPGHTSTPPVVLLHGFDSSSLEFRRLFPLLEQHTDTWAIDLIGWGFTETGFDKDVTRALGPQQKREHLYAWWKEYVGRPMVLVGASLGGAVAIDFAYEHPEAVSKIVLVDAQGFIDGIGPMASLPRPLAMLGVNVLRSVPLRQAANKMAYFNKELYATDDACKIGRLHTFLPGWADANCAFMQSGGYSILDKIPKVQQETLILWGRNDEILDPKYATQFEETLPNARLVWVEECGHCAHLEQPQFMCQQVLDFIAEPSP
eukprot:jgi/Tetstr1/466082/TSEL_010668.t2